MSQKHRVGHLFRRGTNFYVRWVVEGKVFSRALRDDKGESITTKREAEEARRKFMAPFTVATEMEALESIRGKLEGRKAEMARMEDEQNPPLTLEHAWGQYLASPNRPDSGPETLYQYKCQWTAFTDWMAKEHAEIPTLRGVGRKIAEEYAASLNGGRFSPNTYNKHLGLLTLVFRVVKHKAKLTENPWEDIQRKRLVTHSRRELTLAELKTVCQSAVGELKTLLALGVYSGLRLGDCATLRWAEVDLGQGMIRRIPNKTARRTAKPVIVPIHPVLRDMLGKVPREGRGEHVLPEMAGLYGNRIDLVTDRVQAHFLACGIKPHKTGTGKVKPPKADPAKGDSGKTEKPGKDEPRQRAVLEVGFHSLRHTFVSLCRESNAPLAVVESIVGHSNPAMTRHYTHVGELAAGLAVAALPSVMGEAAATPDAAGMDLAGLVGKLRGVLEVVNEKNWKEKRVEGLALVAEIETGLRNG